MEHVEYELMVCQVGENAEEVTGKALVVSDSEIERSGAIYHIEAFVSYRVLGGEVACDKPGMAIA